RRVYGTEHYNIAVNLNNLAAFHQARGDFAQAEAMYCRALAIKETIFGCDNVEVALTVNNLGVLYKAQGRAEQAVVLFRRASGYMIQQRYVGVATWGCVYEAWEALWRCRRGQTVSTPFEHHGRMGSFESQQTRFVTDGLQDCLFTRCQRSLVLFSQ